MDAMIHHHVEAGHMEDYGDARGVEKVYDDTPRKRGRPVGSKNGPKRFEDMMPSLIGQRLHEGIVSRRGAPTLAERVHRASIALPQVHAAIARLQELLEEGFLMKAKLEATLTRPESGSPEDDGSMPDASAGSGSPTHGKRSGMKRPRNLYDSESLSALAGQVVSEDVGMPGGTTAAKMNNAQRMRTGRPRKHTEDNGELEGDAAVIGQYGDMIMAGGGEDGLAPMV